MGKFKSRIVVCVDCKQGFVTSSNNAKRCHAYRVLEQRLQVATWSKKRSQSRAEVSKDMPKSRSDWDRHNYQFLVVADPSGDFRPGKAMFSRIEVLTSVVNFPTGMVLFDQVNDRYFEIENGRIKERSEEC